MAIDASVGPTLVVTALVLFLVLRRAYRMYLGTPLRPVQLFALSALYVALFVLLAAFESLPLLPWWSTVLDLPVGVAAAVVAFEYVDRRVQIYRAGEVWMFRIGLLVPVVYVGLFVLRLVLELVVVGINPFAGSPTLPVLTPFEADVLIGVDALFAFSTGLVVGRNVGVYRSYERHRRSAGAPVSPPTIRPGG